MGVDVGFGHPLYRATAHNDRYAYSDNLWLNAGRQAANGQGPIIITHLRGFLAGYGGSRNMRIDLVGRVATPYRTVGSAGSAVDQGWWAIEGSGYVANGEYRRVQFDSTNGEFYYGRGGGGTVRHPYGSWNDGYLTGWYSYVEAPTPPSGLVSSPSATVAGNIDLSWNGPSSDGGTGVNGYRVYWSTNPGALDSGYADGWWDVGGTGAAFSGYAGVTYYFRVAAKNWVTDTAGTTSHWSNRTGAVAPGPTSPPQNLTATSHANTSGAINLAWQAPASLGSGGTITYRVYRTDGTLYVGGHPSTSYTVTGLIPGTSYTFDVRADNSFGGSDASNRVTATAPGNPSSPRSLTANASTTVGGRIALSWLAPTTPVSTITGYNIYRDGTAIANVSGTTLTANIDGHTPTTSYSFTVRARNAFSDTNGQMSPDSNSASATAQGLPTAPRSLTATASQTVAGRVDLSWTAPSNTAGGVQFYNIYRNGALIASTNGATTYAATGLANQTSYSFYVTARNQFAIDNSTESPASNTASATAPGLPSAPLNLTAIADQNVAGRISLDWDPPTETAGGITRYSVYYSTGTFIADTASNVTAYVVDGLAPGSTYGFYIKAWNAVADSANTPSAQSNTATTQALGDPEPPTNLTVTQSTAVAGRLIFSWSSPSDRFTVYLNSLNNAPDAIVRGTTYVRDNLPLDVPTTFYVRARNSVTDQAGIAGGDAAGPVSGTPSSTVNQATPNYSATNNTNTALSGTYAISSVAASTLSYVRATDPVASTSVPSGSIANNTNQTLNGSGVIATPTANTFTYARVINDIPVGTAVSNGAAVNTTNQSMNGSKTLTGADGTNGVIQYANSGPDIATVAASGNITNTSNAVYNGENLLISAVTADSISYLKTGAPNQALTSATGDVINITNRDIYNGVYDVADVPNHKSLTYVPGGDHADVVNATNLVTNPRGKTVASGTTVLRRNVFNQTRTALSGTITTGASAFGETWARYSAGSIVRHWADQADLVNNAMYTVSTEVYNEGTAPATVYLDWCDVGNGQNPVTIAAGERRRISITATRATLDSTYRFADLSTDVALLVREFMIEQTDQVRPYFDGSTSDAFGWDYEWAGTSGASASNAKAAYVAVRTNLIPNPSFETNTTGWSNEANVTIAQSTAQANTGTTSLLVTKTTLAANSAGVLYTASGLTVGATYTLSMAIRRNTGDNSPFILAVGVGNGAYLNLTTTWTRYSYTFVATATSHNVGINSGAATVASSSFYVDSVLLEAGSASGTYFDGSVASSGDFMNVWTGTANASTSERRAVAVGNAVQTTSSPALFWSFASSSMAVRARPVMNSPAQMNQFVSSATAAGKTYTVVAKVWASASGTTLNGTVGIRETAGTIRSFPLIPSGSALPTTPTVYRALATIPSDIVTGLRFDFRGAADPAISVYFDEILIVEGEYAGDYFDGDYVDTPVTAYAWTGAAHASTSTRTSDSAESDIPTPYGGASRTTSSAELEIMYRSGWAG